MHVSAITLAIKLKNLYIASKRIKFYAKFMFEWRHKTKLISRECQNHVESRKLGEPSLDTRSLPQQRLVLSFLRVFVLKELNAGAGAVWYRD